MDLVLTRLKLFLVCSFCLLIFSFSFVLQFGQLGHGTVDNCDWPMVVDDLRGFGATDVACGTKHSVVVSVTGETVSFGFGGNGRLGNGNVQGTLIPYPVTFQDQVRWLLFFGVVIGCVASASIIFLFFFFYLFPFFFFRPPLICLSVCVCLSLSFLPHRVSAVQRTQVVTTQCRSMQARHTLVSSRHVARRTRVVLVRTVG